MSAPADDAAGDERRAQPRGVDLAREAAKRRDAAVTLRARRRERALQEKRACTDPATPPPANGTVGVVALRSAAAALHAGGAEAQSAARTLRQLLSRPAPPLDAVVEARCLPPLVALLGCGDGGVQLDAAWALNNVAAGEGRHTSAVCAAGAAAPLCALLGSPDAEVRTQAAWALGNIAGDGAVGRDHVAATGAAAALTAAIHSQGAGAEELRQLAWCAANLLRGKPLPEPPAVLPLLPSVAALLTHGDEEVAEHACWAASYAVDGADERIEAALRHGLLAPVVRHLHAPERSPLIPAVRFCGNVASGAEELTQALLDAGAVPPLVTLLRHPDRDVRKECCWGLANVTAGTRAQLQHLGAAGGLPPLIAAMAAPEQEVRKEAVYAVSNFISGGTKEQIHAAAAAGCLPPLVEVLASPSVPLVKISLQALADVVASGDAIVDEMGGSNEYRAWMYRNAAVEKIEELQHAADEGVYQLALQVIEQHFGAAEEEDAAARYFDPGAPPEELRIDASDGNVYPLASFVEEYGAVEGAKRWNDAEPLPNCHATGAEPLPAAAVVEEAEGGMSVDAAAATTQPVPFSF